MWAVYTFDFGNYLRKNFELLFLIWYYCIKWFIRHKPEKRKCQ